MNDLFIYSDDVKNALDNNQPIVALESTIITHGMPYPDNLNMALKVEEIIKNSGVTPATIAVIDGNIHIGLSSKLLQELSKAKDVKKISRSDLSYVVSKKLTGGTTVAATMLIIKRAGIKFFATGGIGGVHRDFDLLMDVSADLEELSKTDVCVISAGPKAILDLAKTLEYLETKGVAVIGYKTGFLPAFYSHKSPYPLYIRLDNATDIASLVKTQEKLHIKTGILVTNPIPKEKEIPYLIIKKDIDQALIKAKNKNITGKALTPFLLEEIKNITKGKSLLANLELVYNNAKLASEIAKAYKQIND